MSAITDYTGDLTISMPASDLDRSIAWYEAVLGFSLLYRLDDMGWCEMTTAVPDVNVGLSVVEAPSPGAVTPTFGVRDIAAAKSALEAADVRIDGDILTIEGMVSLLTFFDADDNPLMFSQDLRAND